MIPNAGQPPHASRRPARRPQCAPLSVATGEWPGCAQGIPGFADGETDWTMLLDLLNRGVSCPRPNGPRAVRDLKGCQNEAERPQPKGPQGQRVRDGSEGQQGQAQASEEETAEALPRREPSPQGRGKGSVGLRASGALEKRAIGTATTLSASGANTELQRQTLQRSQRSDPSPGWGDRRAVPKSSPTTATQDVSAP